MDSFLHHVKQFHKGAKPIHLATMWFGRMLILSGLVTLFFEHIWPVGVAFISVGILLHLPIMNQVYFPNFASFRLKQRRKRKRSRK